VGLKPNSQPCLFLLYILCCYTGRSAESQATYSRNSFTNPAFLPVSKKVLRTNSQLA
jgi:hypothetical protein